MALTLGTDAYITLADYKAWADARGYNYGTDAEVEAAIVIATDYIDASYSFKGDPLDDDQPLQLPTDSVSIADIEKAVAQAVYQQLLGRLTVSLEDMSANGTLEGETSKVGSLSESLQYRAGTERTVAYSTTLIDRALRPYLLVSSVMGGVVRC